MTTQRYRYIPVSCTAANRTCYGIAYAALYDGSVVLLESYPDLTSDPQVMEWFAALCTLLDLDPVHLQDVVEDFLAETGPL